MDTIVWGQDTTTGQWRTKINAAIGAANYKEEPDLEDLNLVSEGFEEWAEKINDLIQTYVSISNDTIVYGTDNLGVWKVKTNAIIKYYKEE